MCKMTKLLCGLGVGILTLFSFCPEETAAAETDIPELMLQEEEADAEEEDKDVSRAQLVIDHYEISKGVFERSSECTLRIHIRNVSKESAATEGIITMYSGTVYPVFGKANQITFDEIQPGESIFVDFDVNLDRIVNGPNPIEFVL